MTELEKYAINQIRVAVAALEMEHKSRVEAFNDDDFPPYSYTQVSDSIRRITYATDNLTEELGNVT